jgi:hypothetical protein
MPASSGVYQDDIARQQANFQGAFQNYDLAERKLQLKKANFDLAMYEKMNTPNPAKVREEVRLERLDRARNTPPANEISSGEALNVLLADIQRMQSRRAVAGTTTPVDADTLGRLNVSTTGDASGGNELFKPGALAKWPALLAGENFAEERKKLTSALVEAARGQAAGVVDDAKCAETKRLLDAMHDKLFEVRLSASTGDYANALGFLNKLTETVNILGKQDAANFLNGTYRAKGETVAQLVDHMNSHGLKFIPATKGDEPHYAKVYQMVLKYNLELSGKIEQEMSTQVSVKK